MEENCFYLKQAVSTPHPCSFCMFPRQVMALLVGRNRDVILKLKPGSLAEDVRTKQLSPSLMRLWRAVLSDVLITGNISRGGWGGWRFVMSWWGARSSTLHLQFDNYKCSSPRIWLSRYSDGTGALISVHRAGLVPILCHFWTPPSNNGAPLHSRVLPNVSLFLCCSPVAGTNCCCEERHIRTHVSWNEQSCEHDENGKGPIIMSKVQAKIMKKVTRKIEIKSKLLRKQELIGWYSITITVQDIIHRPVLCLNMTFWSLDSVSAFR
jgi:hypothetical protein